MFRNIPDSNVLSVGIYVGQEKCGTIFSKEHAEYLRSLLSHLKLTDCSNNDNSEE